MSRNKKIKQITDLLTGRITKKDILSQRIYFKEKAVKGDNILYDRTTFEGREVTTVPKGATIWNETKTYSNE